jgi:hypothetical protein
LLSELKHYQSQYGGRLNIISRFEDVLETQTDSNNSLDKDVEDDECDNNYYMQNNQRRKRILCIKYFW